MVGIDIASWLQAIGLGQYAQAFADNHIDAELLSLLSESDLKELGVDSLGHRKQLLRAIARLPAQSKAAAPDEPAGQLDLSERRMVSILFCDITDFTRISVEHDPEEVHGLLNRYFEIVDNIVRLYDGYVDKHIGDAVMAVFGAPVAHTNDPERAVRAAFDIHRAVHGLSPPIRVHSGIACGPVVASRTGSQAHREYTMVGSAVNLASRLQHLAAPDEILVSESVHRAVARWIESTPLDPGISLKGIDEPGQIWRIERLRSEALCDSPASFVGRRVELGRFTERLAVCRARGKGQVILVKGEAGIGKTRLVEEFRSLAEAQGFGHHTGLVLDFGDGGGQGAITELVCSLLGLGRGSTAEQRAQAVQRARTLVSSQRDVYLYDLLDLPQPSQLRARYDAMPHESRSRGRLETLVELVNQCAAQQPLLLIVEDVHWADAAVMDSLQHLAQAIGNSPVLLLMTSRVEDEPLAMLARTPGEAPDSGQLAGQTAGQIAGQTQGVTIDVMQLAPLQQDEALELASHFMESQSQLMRSCIERSGGNPLFLEQLLRNVERTTLEFLPDSLQSLVQARIDHLPVRDKHALQTASVMGQRFTLAALRFLLDDPTYVCDRLIAEHLVRPLGDELLFGHELLREGVYSSLLRSRRRALHLKAAAWYGERNPVLHAEQLERAEDPAAARTYLEAARGQANEFRFERALQLVERGLQLAREQAVQYALTCFRADLLRELGSIHDSVSVFEHALALASDELERCRAWLGMAKGLRVVDRSNEASAFLDLAQEVATRHDLAEELATIHYLRGSLLFPSGDIDGCLAEQEKARDHARRAGSPEREAQALSGIGDAYYMRGWIISAHVQFARCIELCREHGLGSIEVSNLYMRGLTRYYQNELDAALHDCMDAARLATQVGNKRAELIARSGCLGFILFETGRFDDAREEFEKALELACALGSRRFQPNSLTFFGKMLAVQGRRAEARALIEQSVAVCHDTGFTFVGPMALSALALTLDDPAERVRLLAEAEAVLRTGAPSHNHFYVYTDAMNVSLAMGDADGLERYASALEAYTRHEPLPWSDFFIARGRALAAHLREPHCPTVMAGLHRLHAQARSLGLHVAAKALAQAAASAA